MSKFAILFLLVGITLVGCSDHASATKAYLARSVSVDGKEYGYRVLVPEGRDPNKKLPVMLFLHGSGSRGEDNVAEIDGFRWA